MTHRTSSSSDFSRVQRDAVLTAIHDSWPPKRGNPEELAQWVTSQIDRGRTEGEVAIDLGWTVNQVRTAIAGRSAP